MTTRRGPRSAVLAIGLVLAVFGAACGDNAGGSTGRRSVPDSLRKAESAAKDSVDSILAGKRDKTIRSAQTLDDLAEGRLAEDLEGTVTKEELGELQARADALVKIAPEGEPAAVELAAKHVLELLAGFFGRFETQAHGLDLVNWFEDL